MFCPSCESVMDDKAKYCGRCGLGLNRSSDRLMHLSLDFAWIWRRSWGGFAAGFVGWIIVFIITRMVGQSASPMMVNIFAGMISGVFLGTVGGIIEESAYKAFMGGILGTVGGALGGLLNIPIMAWFQDSARLFPLSVLATWAVGGAFIGATSGIIEKGNRKILAGVLFGLLGGAIGGFLGSVFYGSVQLEFKPDGWLSGRLAEGLSGGLVGAVLWFFLGFIEKLYIFRRREDPRINEKVCDHCGKHNSLRYWYCIACGHVLQTAAPRQKIVTSPYRGMERIINALRFMSWLFGATGVITTPVVFLIFLAQDIFLACISAVFAILLTYLMMVGFRFIADLLSSLVKISSSAKTEG